MIIHNDYNNDNKNNELLKWHNKPQGLKNLHVGCSSFPNLKQAWNIEMYNFSGYRYTAIM